MLHETSAEEVGDVKRNLNACLTFQDSSHCANQTDSQILIFMKGRLQNSPTSGS